MENYNGDGVRFDAPADTNNQDTLDLAGGEEEA